MSFPQLKHFKISDNWGDPLKMHPELLVKLDAFREYLGHPIIVTCGTQGKHEVGSQHYTGRAVDVVFPNLQMHPVNLIFNAERFSFTGLGYYTNWIYKGAPVHGMHLDVRELFINSDPYHYREARWLGIADKKTGKQSYAPFTLANIERYTPAELLPVP